VIGFPYLIEAALLLLIAFIVGCYLGAGIRRLAPRRSVAAVASQPEVSASLPMESPAAAAVPELPQPTQAVVVEATPRMSSRVKPQAAAPAAEPSVKPPADPRPPALDAPRSGVKDDLKQIKGIGPRIEASLNELGIFHFSQIARWTKKHAAWVDERLNLKGRIARENWIGQARELSKR